MSQSITVPGLSIMNPLPFVAVGFESESLLAFCAMASYLRMSIKRDLPLAKNNVIEKCNTKESESY